MACLVIWRRPLVSLICRVSSVFDFQCKYKVQYCVGTVGNIDFYSQKEADSSPSVKAFLVMLWTETKISKCCSFRMCLIQVLYTQSQPSKLTHLIYKDYCGFKVTFICSIPTLCYLSDASENGQGVFLEIWFLFWWSPPTPLSIPIQDYGEASWNVTCIILSCSIPPGAIRDHRIKPPHPPPHVKVSRQLHWTTCRYPVQSLKVYFAAQIIVPGQALLAANQALTVAFCENRTLLRKHMNLNRCTCVGMDITHNHGIISHV